MVKNEYKSMYEAEKEKQENSLVNKSFKRGFTTINNLKRSLVLAKTSQEALQGLPIDSKSYYETMKMLEDNLLKASALMLSVELDFRNIHHNFKKGSE